MTQESAAEVLAFGSVRINNSCQSATSAKLDQILWPSMTSSPPSTRPRVLRLARSDPAVLRRAAGDQRRSGMIQAYKGCVERRGRARAGIFLEPYDLLEDREAAAAHLLRPGDSRPAALRLGSLPCEHIVPRGGTILRRRLGWHIGLQPLARLAAKSRDRSGHAALHFRPLSCSARVPRGSVASIPCPRRSWAERPK